MLYEVITLKFRVGCSKEGHHHHHMICLQCEKTYPIHFCPMPMTDAPEEFQIVKHKFEVFGYCKNCRPDKCQDPASRITSYNVCYTKLLREGE